MLADFRPEGPFSAFGTEVLSPVPLQTSVLDARFRHFRRKVHALYTYRLPSLNPVFTVWDGSQGSLPYGNAVMIRREPYGGSPSGSTKPTGHRPVGFVELMGGVEQISASRNVEISRKERRPSYGVSRSVSKRYLFTFNLSALILLSLRESALHLQSHSISQL